MRADLAGDGVPDILVPRSACELNGSPAGCAAGDVFIFDRKSDAALDSTVQYSLGKHPYVLRAADLSADGVPDIIALNSVSGDVVVRLSSENGTYDHALVVPTPATRTRMAIDIGDMNEDGSADFFVALNTVNLGYLYLSNP